jgi:poly(A) polymerase
LNERETLSAIRPELDGDQVMSLLELRPSRAVGDALEFLLEIRLEEGLIGDGAAKARLLAWWEERNSGR